MKESVTTPPIPFVVRPAAAPAVENELQGRSAGSTDAAAVHAERLAVILEDERNPELASIRAERDRAYDAVFYTGLGREVARRIQWEIDRAALRR